MYCDVLRDILDLGRPKESPVVDWEILKQAVRFNHGGLPT